MSPLLAALLPLALAAAAPAAPAASGAPKALLGKWDLGGVSEGAEWCRIVLKPDASIGGWAVERARDCARKFPFTRDINAWHVERGAVVFTDPLRRPLIRLERTEDGSYVGGDDDGPVGVLMIGRPSTGAPPTAQQQMSGAWSITGMGGAPRCGFVSRANASASAGTLAMQPGCAAAFANRGWTSWTLKGDTLTLLDAKGRVLQAFKRGDVVTFEGEDAHGDLIYFSRD